MEVSSFTRESLFREAADIISRKEKYVEFENPDIVIDMYSNSAKILHGIEDIINSNELRVENWNLNDKLIENLNEVNDITFVLFVRNSIETQQSSQSTKRSVTYKENFRFLLKAITEYQEQIISE